MSYNLARREEMSREMGTIYMALDAVTKFVAEWLDKNLKTLDSDYWNRYVITSLYAAQRETVKANGAKTVFDLDQPTILSVFIQNKPVLVGKLGIDPQLFGYAHSIKDIRNKYFHKNSKPLPQKRFKHDIGTIELFLEGLGAGREVTDAVKGDFTKAKDDETQTSHMVEVEKHITIKVPHASSPITVTNASPTGVIAVAPVSTLKEDAARYGSVNRPYDMRGVLKSGSCATDVCRVSSPSILKDPQELYESIVNSLKLDFAEYRFGACNLYRSGDKLPSEVLIKQEWTWVITLKILEVNKERIANDISTFHRTEERVGVVPHIVGDYAIWVCAVQSSCREGGKYLSRQLEVDFADTVFLPNWYRAAISAIEGVVYQTDRIGVRQTLNASDAARRQYLGTYAPRSFAEMTALADFAFAKRPESVRKINSEISIIDVGSGSGAAAMGLIWSLKKLRLPQIRTISICAIDGNEMALKLMEALMSDLRNAWPSVEIKFTPILTSDIAEIVRACKSPVKFSVSSKFLQELSSGDSMQCIERTLIASLQTNGMLFWVANPGISDSADTFMQATGRNNVVVSCESKDVNICGIPGRSESVVETITCLVEAKQAS